MLELRLVCTPPISTALCYPLPAQVDGATTVLAAKRVTPQEREGRRWNVATRNAGARPGLLRQSSGVGRHLRSYPNPGGKMQIQLRHLDVLD